MTAPSGIVTFLSDFGLTDPFVGLMHGVVLARFPQARIVDLTHGVAPHDVVEGCFWIERSFGWLPEGTVHVAVVDPGVGTGRAALCVAVDGHLLLGPDNGLLGGLAARAADVRVIDLVRLGLPEPSRTFHGRDVFAPVAAELAAGRITLSDVGDPAQMFVKRAVPEPDVREHETCGVVVAIDRFGNLITNLGPRELTRFAAPEVSVGPVTESLSRSYADARPGAPVMLVNAFGALEIAIRDGSAAEVLGVGRGTEVRVGG